VPQGALQILHFVQDDKGRGAAEVGVVTGWEEPQVASIEAMAFLIHRGREIGYANSASEPPV
jgi:hypothetical protein